MKRDDSYDKNHSNAFLIFIPLNYYGSIVFVLYYLEPFIELKNPLFRMGTARNHISKEVNGLLADGGGIDVTVMTSSPVKKRCIDEQLFHPRAELVALSQSTLREIFPGGYYEASRVWYEGGYDGKQVDAIAAVVRSALKERHPDVVICYESTAPFFKDLYPNALVINSSLGIFSREPFPETMCFDPEGVYKNSFICKFKSEVHSFRPDARAYELTRQMKRLYQEAVSALNPFLESEVRRGKRPLLLLPLQVSQYFAFDFNVPADSGIRTQLDLIHYVMKRAPAGVDVLATQHGAESDVLTDQSYPSLQALYPNLIYLPKSDRVRWSSQYLLPLCDGVVTVSSSVGMQALLWDKHVWTIGDAHPKAISESLSLEQADIALSRAPERDNDAILYFVLKYLCPLMERYVHNGVKFGSFLRESLRRYREGISGLAALTPMEGDDEVLFSALMQSLRPAKAVVNMEKSGELFPVVGVMDRLKGMIKEADVVSFDFFDTLVTRRLLHANTLFDLMELPASRIFSEAGKDLAALGGFRELREQAANFVMKRTKESSGGAEEEIELDEIYKRIQKVSGLNPASINALKRLELDTEKQLTRVRRSGKDLFDYAKSLGKRVIIVSDIYLPESFVRLAMRRCGYETADALYVSSTHKKLKKTGGLFTIVLHSEGFTANPRRVLHIGDNVVSDVQMAEAAGMRSAHLPNSTDLYLRGKAGKRMFNGMLSQATKYPGLSVYWGSISRKFYDLKEYEDSWFGRSAYFLGYAGCGPFFLSFAKWALDTAIREKMDVIYFLARDGWLVKQIYDRLAADVPGAPASVYLLASRRCYNTASLTDVDSVIESLELKFSALPLSELIKNRFDLEVNEAVQEAALKAGFESVDTIVDIKRSSHVRKLKSFLTHIAPLVLENSAEERRNLLNYLRDQGVLDRSKRKCILDIGHNATLQEALCKITGDKSFMGLYFCTFYSALKRYNMGLDVRGYYLNFTENSISEDPYCSNIGMYEFVFLPDKESFKKFDCDANGSPVPVFVGGDESRRFEVIREVHRGVMDFCINVLETSGGGASLPDVPKEYAVHLFNSFLRYPSPKDADIVNGVAFVDAFGGSAARKLIADPVDGDKSRIETIKKSWWREGAEVKYKGKSSR